MNDPSSTTAPVNSVRKSECSQCGGVRNCDIRGKHVAHYNDEQLSACTEWYILECRGCEHVFVQTIGTNSEDYYHYYEENGSTGTAVNETIKYWPALSKRKKPEWMSDYGIAAENVGEVLNLLEK